MARLASSLTKTRTAFVEKLGQVLSGRTVIDEGLYEELEEILIQADVGVPTAAGLVEAVRKRVSRGRVKDPSAVTSLLQEEMQRILEGGSASLAQSSPTRPLVYLMVGVNGTGKTTSIAKLAYRFKGEGRQVMLCAADTFRAAAIDQLEVWAQRIGVDLIKHQEGSDPAAVAFDSIQAAIARGTDVLLIDTAGRLQTKTHLMQELAKITRVVTRELGREPDEVLLVLDATTGQNGMSQARLFAEATPLSGVVLTKLDGTAKGGIILAIASEMQLPVKLIGIGEGMDDLRDFDPAAFAAALFGTPDVRA